MTTRNVPRLVGSRPLCLGCEKDAALQRRASESLPDGALRAYLGHFPVHEIRKPLLLEWRQAEVVGKTRAAKKGATTSTP